MLDTSMNVESKDCFIVSIGTIGYYRALPNSSNSQYVIENSAIKATLFDTIDSAKSIVRILKQMRTYKERHIEIKISKTRLTIAYLSID